MQFGLGYISNGQRFYGREPIQPRTRLFWEFQAVTKGRIAPLTPDGPGDWREHSLWLFAPNNIHGWIGHHQSPAEIVVLHFEKVDPLLQRIALGRGGMLCVRLNLSDCTFLRDLCGKLLLDWQRPNEFTRLKVEHALGWLSLKVIENCGYIAKSITENLDEERLARAVYWYRMHLSENPDIEHVAHAAGVSQVHLRRICRKLHGCSPKDYLQNIQLDYIKRRLADPNVSVEQVAGELNYADASSLTRAFKRLTGTTPRRK